MTRLLRTLCLFWKAEMAEGEEKGTSENLLISARFELKLAEYALAEGPSHVDAGTEMDQR
jgi:hypothetical protein